MRLKVLSSLLALGFATAAVAQGQPSPFTFTLKGFVSATMFMQDNSMGVTNAGGGAGNADGQQALFAAQPNRTVDKLIFGGDVRQTRLNFAVKGPEVLGGATPTGVVEIDFFGIMGPGNYGESNVINRLRLAYVETAWANDVLRVGQFHNLIIGFIPASAAHLAFPFAYGAGLIGWRNPGVTYLHKMKTSGGLNVELGAQVNRNSWNDAAPVIPAPVGGVPNYGQNVVNSSAQAGFPQLQARVMISQGTNVSPFPLYPVADWLFFAAVHYDQKDLTGAGAVAGVNQKDKLSTYAVQAGFKSNQLQNVTLAVNGWFGQNTGNLLGQIVQIGPNAQSAAGQSLVNVSSYGAWGQAGYAFGSNWSLWGFAGFEHPDWLKAPQAYGAGARVRNVNTAAMLSYRDGPWLFGLEWLHSFTTFGTYVPASNTTTTNSLNANQYLGTVDYFF